MNRIKLLIIATLCTTAAFSQISTGDGYYRVRNADDRGRYISVVDNRGSVSVATTSADMGALKTLAGGFNRVVSDPSTIVYFLNKGGKEYDMHTQGTSSYSIVGYTILVKGFCNICNCLNFTFGIKIYTAKNITNMRVQLL